MSEALILTGEGYGLSIAPEAEAQKGELLKHSALIVEVKDNTASEAARNQVKKLAAMRLLVEKSRKQIKEPVLKLGKDIDTKASQFLTELVQEETRISALISTHAAEVERLRQEAERDRQRLERERIEAERKAEQERIAAEQARLKAEKEAEEARLKADQEAAAASGDDIDEQIRLAEAIDAENEAKAKAARVEEEERQAEDARQAERARIEMEERQAAMLASSRSTKGVKFTYDYEVTDIAALYGYDRSLCEVTPRRRELLVEIQRTMAMGENLTIPGISITKKAVVSTR